MDSKTVMDWVTFGIAVLGAVLGVFNAWRDWVKSRARIRVRVSRAITFDGDEALTLNVVNLSDFPVTVTHIGFYFVGTDRHAQIPRPIFTQGETLPVRLESRAACTVLQPLSAFPKERWLQVREAYVSTACDMTVSGGKAFFSKYRAAIAAQQA